MNARRLLRPVLAALAGLVLCPPLVAAQSDATRFEAGAQVAVADSSQFDEVAVGFGGRFAWYPGAVVGLEAEFNRYSSDSEGISGFTLPRSEGLFGVTVGPRLSGVRPFARLRAGFLTYAQAQERISCIAVYPPPLACVLAAGDTLAAFDIGGGVELLIGTRSFVRFDVGDRIVRYPGPAYDSDLNVHDDSFLGHDFRFAAGAGVRF